MRTCWSASSVHVYADVDVCGIGRLTWRSRRWVQVYVDGIYSLYIEDVRSNPPMPAQPGGTKPSLASPLGSMNTPGAVVIRRASPVFARHVA